ncbi:MAG: YjbQ family protein [Candidatus Binatia bacterium]
MRAHTEYLWFDRAGEDTAAAHRERTLVHHRVVLPVTKEKRGLGPWAQVFSPEFDGRRKKHVVVKILGE